MAYNGQPRPRPPLHSSASSNSLSRISTVSDITDFETYSDGVTSSPALHGRPSLVSLQSYDGDGPRSRSVSVDDGNPYLGAQVGWSSFTGYPGNGAYEPLNPVGEGSPPQPQRKQSRGFGYSMSMKQQRHETIPEEEYDLGQVGLLKAAAPLGEEPPALIDKESPSMDLSSIVGPSTSADDAFLKRLQEQEAQGKLTGGLGLGIKADTVLTGSALLATSPIPEKAPWTQAFGPVGGAKELSRRDTVKQVAQNEANKRGKVIEVIIEEDEVPAGQSEVDLSLMEGPDAGLSDGTGNGNTRFLRKKSEKTEVFYPQPNWKPFSMRWPYLLSLIAVSIVLGGGVEVLYQKSAREPLVSFHEPSEIPAIEYFAFKFLPTLITVSYGVLWQITDFEVRRLEAFFQLSKEGGALASESINVDYITYFSFFRPLRALQCKHYAVAVSSIASLLANAAVPTLGAACIFLSPDRETRLNNPENEKQILVHHLWSRFLTAVFCVLGLLGCMLFYQLESRRSGLLADVRGIAGLASMATVSHILMDFKDMDVATHEDIHNKLRDRRYVLLNSSLTPDDTQGTMKQETTKYNRSDLSQNPHPLMLRKKGAVPFIVGIFLFMTLLPVFLFTPATIIADKAPWLITALAVCIKLSWNALETNVRMMEPYYILSRRHAPPKMLTLDYTAMPFGWVALRGAMNGHWLVFFVGFGTIMTEILTVLVTSLATVEGRVFVALIKKENGHGHDNAHNNKRDHEDDAAKDINAGQETAVSFWISLALAIFILTYMGIVASVVFLRRKRVFLPRQPNTIASVLAFIHQSKMLYDFVGTAKLGNGEMVRKLEGLKKTYGLGWFQGRDGQSHCGVDEEELLSGYSLGYDYSKAREPWTEAEVHWL
ncbi:hypothetical protein QBC37DRAFT_201780 [Rhypophila decipiens]|uniref:Spray n=1 Tax=Rhypophila decipiens TaxID=261697 RepID=A0AAN7B450_9PEZI|nr:hypothetical protein QBC37DRAFT_201780 [Rhypophila decipiens]